MKYVNVDQKIGLMCKLQECAYARTVPSFNQKIKILKQCSPTVVGNFLKDLHPKHWANAYFRYGEMQSNAAKSFNNWIRKARHLPITYLVDAIRGQIMEQMVKHKAKCSMQVGELCPKMEKNLDSVFKNSKLWIVSQVNENVFEVLSHPSMSVDINAPTCLHFQWQLNGFPCPHTRLLHFGIMAETYMTTSTSSTMLRSLGQHILGLFTQFLWWKNPSSIGQIT